MDTVLVRFCLGLLCLLYCVGNSSPHNCKDIKNPSLGDLCVDSDDSKKTFPGVVLIYYTDNVEQPQWGAICDGSGTTDYALKVMCQQLGFVCATPNIAPEKNYSSKTWFKDLHCPQDTHIQHILRCHTTRYSKVEECEQGVIRLQCEGEKEFRPKNPYDGQVFLFSPDNATEPGQQVSLGLVLIYHSEQWGGITQDTEHPLSSNAADSICRQLGYTQADPQSITTKEYSPLKNFTFPEDEKVSWLMTNATNVCLNSSEACFTCCFNQSMNSKCTIDDCPERNYVVLQCLFDSRNNLLIVSEGNSSLCSLNNNSLGYCFSKSSDISPPTFELLTIGFGIAFVVTLLALLISIVINIVLYRKRRVLRPEEQPLLRNMPNNLDDNQN